MVNLIIAYGLIAVVLLAYGASVYLRGRAAREGLAALNASTNE